MLSAETASGAFPLEAVRLMDRTCRQAEAVLDFQETFADLRSQVRVALWPVCRVRAALSPVSREGEFP